jgi:Ribbon-helix-helix protein, copG family
VIHEPARPGVSMPAHLVAAIDKAAKEKGWSRSLLIREAVLIWLRGNGFATSVQPAEPTEKAS